MGREKLARMIFTNVITRREVATGHQIGTIWRQPIDQHLADAGAIVSPWLPPKQTVGVPGSLAGLSEVRRGRRTQL